VTGFQGEIRRGAPNHVAALRVLRAVWTILARPVLRHALALCVALGIPAAILFSSNGLRASDVVTPCHRSLLTRSLLWLGWLVLSAPALRALFEARGSKTLRALRLPRGSLVMSLFILAALVQTPWAILFARGGGPIEAWAAVTLAVALGASCVAGLRRWQWALGAACGVLLLAWDPAPLVLALCGSVCAPFALYAAWQCALEQRRASFGFSRPTQPLLAVYLVHLLRLFRSAQSRLTTACVSGVAGGIGLIFSLRNDPTERSVARALAAMALPLTLAAAVCVAPVLESEAALRTVLRSLRVPRSLVLTAFFLAIATPSSALAAGTGVVASTAGHASASALSMTLFAWAVALSSAVGVWGRFLEQRARRTAGTFAAGVTLIAVLALMLALSW
jgi:hypothetical protein